LSARDDLSRAGEEARAQVREARAALAASREARAGGAAKNARQAEQQLHALRDAVSDDVRALRDRLTGLDASARRGAATATAVGAGTLVTLVGTGLALRGSLRRAAEQRGVHKQALALAAALAAQASGSDDRRAGRARTGRRGRRGALLTAIAVGAAVTAAAVAQQRRTAPIDDDDLWLPEHDLGRA
jgi:hypothetical protein